MSKNDDPANSSRPSDSVTDFAFIRLLPSLATQPSIDTLSPTFTTSLFQPYRVRVDGLPISTVHVPLTPRSSFASRVTCAWGFAQSIFVTDPSRVVGFFQSKSDWNVWCPYAGNTARTPAAINAMMALRMVR